MTRRKGADLLPQIMEGLGNDFVLYFTSGREKNGKNKPSDNMIPLGKLGKEEMRSQYQKADLLLFPSRLEGLPLVVIEAMACGTPVICHSSASLPEVIDQGSNGYMCSLDDVDCFIKKIKEFKDAPEKLAQFGLASRNKITSEFSQQTMTMQYIKEFKKMKFDE